MAFVNLRLRMSLPEICIINLSVAILLHSQKSRCGMFCRWKSRLLKIASIVDIRGQSTRVSFVVYSRPCLHLKLRRVLVDWIRHISVYTWFLNPSLLITF